MIRFSASIFPLVVLLLSSPSAAKAGGGDRSASLFTLRQESNGWTVVYTGRPTPAGTITLDGLPHTLFQSHFASAGDSGQPSLPSEILSLGIPAGTDFVAELVDPVYAETPNQLVAPVPGLRGTEDREVVNVYRKDRTAYSANRFYPGRELFLDPPFTLRGQRIAALHIAPLQYNPATKILRRLVSGTLRIRTRTGTAIDPSPAKVGTVGDPFFEEIFRSLLANYDQARQWRYSPSKRTAPADSSRDWFVPGRKYYRIPVAADGWYHVTKSDLAAAGANPASIDTSALAVFFRGAGVPIQVRPDSSVEFFGRRNSGDSTYLHFYTDTSAYWLTWEGGPGRRFTPTGQPSGIPSLDIGSVSEKRHFEENTDYYEGTGDAEITNQGPVPGEGWAWEYYYPNSVFTHALTIDSLDVLSPNATIRVRLFSTTPHQTTPNHRARFWINDSLLGEVTFDGRTEGMFSRDFPSMWLHQGSNVLKILSDPPPGALVNQFYLDWFECDYPRPLRAVDDALVFTSPSSSGGGPVRFTVSGFSTPAIDVFDLSGGRRITGGSVTGGPGTGYAIAFQDTFSSVRHYAVVGGSGSRGVIPPVQKIMGDIRTNPGGADFIIITHRDFLPSAQQLAAHRQSVNGVRVRVVDVQDIYDEFNFGVMDAECIKAFLRYAVETWPSPAPACLLMFGDASWDFHRYMPTTIKTNYVPAYGVPAGDNWYGCFDSTYPFIPSLIIGRLPVQSPIQAQRTVAKIIGYDGVSPAEWTKGFLLISAGTTPGEQVEFNSRTDATVNLHVLPPPIGGFAHRVYKTTPNTIDGENKQLLRDIVKQGVVLVSFLGHSGGRIWGMDIGSPNDLENTDGRLPFVASVSCNVGAFAEPSNNVLSEDFVLADGRGAIAMWASSSLGYADIGSDLVNYFFLGVKNDSLRAFGALTTAARLKMWQARGSDYITVASVNLNPLLGDPLSKLALPLKPDLAVSPADIALDVEVPSSNDTALTVSVNVHNYGLVPADSVTVLLTDTFNGLTTPLLNNLRIPPTRFRDSLAVRWRKTSQVGLHTFQATLDPAGVIPEVTKANNVALANKYVYANLLAVIRPLHDMVIAPGSQILRVSSPIGIDSSISHVVFQLDTVSTFNSPFVASSGEVIPGAASAEWTTPALSVGKVYYWRARTVIGSLVGAWVQSLFSTSSVIPSSPLVLWRESSRPQFSAGVLRQTTATDSGVTMGANTPIRLYARSLGTRADANRDYYSLLQVNEQSMTGLWWVHGSGFMAMRVDDFTGVPAFQGFDVPGQAVQSDSLQSFITTTPTGNYLALTVIFDGRTNVSASLRAAIHSLGSTLIDSVQPGDSWSIIARKGSSGPGTVPLEHWSRTDFTADSLQVPNYFSFGSGSVTSPRMPMPQRWSRFRWQNGGVPGTTDQRVALLGIRSGGITDTLRILPKDSLDVSLSGLNATTADSSYVGFSAAGLLSSSDALVSPVLREWSAEFEPPSDLAVSQRTLSAPKIALRKGAGASVTLNVYNIGYRKVDSARVVLSAFETGNTLRAVAYATVDSIPVGGFRTLHIPFETDGLPQQFTVQAKVLPTGSAKELVYENNTALYTFLVTGIEEKLAARVQIYSDGVQLMEGDYVAARPNIIVRVSEVEGAGGVPPRVDLFVDNVQALSPGNTVIGEAAGTHPATGDEAAFAPVLGTGMHELRVRIAQLNTLGKTDSVLQTVRVNVVDDYRILHMYNYPNPFGGETWFTFVLTGVRPPEELTVRIFTVSGRKIRELSAPAGSLQVGFNRVHWDGRDADGDEIANGYYFYQVQLRGEGKIQTAIGKLVKVR